MHSKEAVGAFGELLKDKVSVVFSGDRAKVSYALWEVELPANWVRSQPVINDLLNRRISRAQALQDPTARALIDLLSAQGCFTSVSKSSYSLKEVKELFDPLRSEWYAAYYAHPAWEEIRSGAVDRNVLLAWLLHNYHISRAAGIVAARMAAVGKDRTWQAFFRQDALEEYWHCDAFYSLDTPLLHGVSLADVKAYVPLPGSLAFEEHCLQVAEADPLGHVLIAYFQESSIAFAGASHDFYAEVEDRYGIRGLFDSWKQHIQIDVDHGHAEGLGQLLDSDTEVVATTLERALRNAWLGFHFLYCSLDEIQRERHGEEIRLRRPLEQALTAGFPDCWQALASHLAGETPVQVGSMGDADQAFMLEGIGSSAFRALGFAREHDHVIACGGIANAFARLAGEVGGADALNPWSVAIVNHLQEAASSPVKWLLLVSLLGERFTPLRLGGAAQACIRKALEGFACHQPLTALSQLDELVTCWHGSRERIPQPLRQI